MKVVMFSRFFPAYHPRKGEETFFVEKIWESLLQQELISMSKAVELSNKTGIGNLTINKLRKEKLQPKEHTMREGDRWKVGDMFSARVWSGAPYRSKQIEFAQIEVKKVFDVEFDADGCLWIFGEEEKDDILNTVAKNDGLSKKDFFDWFFKPFIGQIICWNENINY